MADRSDVPCERPDVESMLATPAGLTPSDRAWLERWAQPRWWRRPGDKRAIAVMRALQVACGHERQRLREVCDYIKREELDE